MKGVDEQATDRDPSTPAKIDDQINELRRQIHFAIRNLNRATHRFEDAMPERAADKIKHSLWSALKTLKMVQSGEYVLKCPNPPPTN